MGVGVLAPHPAILGQKLARLGRDQHGQVLRVVELPPVAIGHEPPERSGHFIERRHTPKLPPPGAQRRVMVTLSTAASTRLAPPASAACTRRRMVCPAKLLRFTDCVLQAAASLAAEPSSWNTVVVAPLAATTIMRKK